MEIQLKSNWNQFKINWNRFKIKLKSIEINSKSIDINSKSIEIMLKHFIQKPDYQKNPPYSGTKNCWGVPQH